MIGFWERIVFAFRCFLSILLRAAIPDDIAQKLLKPQLRFNRRRLPLLPRLPASKRLNDQLRTPSIALYKCSPCCNATGG